ncbi:pentapeptide repeat-containing protein [Synechococcus sp. CCAP 1479/9]|uniref:pentapeptide repeat-containing protein n=1 Tax=Synechococcus sp. CCAP 1479/9 TaxID=1221593 RepID=UPI001C239586|nr:pentapeptide repeat-containing protein [Synechococcus sp. CCAP 1479/9]
MVEYHKVVRLLTRNGYNERENISDYWFSNHEELARIVNQRFPYHSQIFDLQVRWRSAMGETRVNALKEHIEHLQEQARLERSRKYQRGDYGRFIELAKIDLNGFVFHFDERECTIKTLVNSFKTSQIEGWHDLRGIPLDGVRVSDSALIGLNFSSASFIGANIQQVDLVNCNFVSANLDDSRFVAVRHGGGTALGGASFRGAFINAVALSDEVVGSPMRIIEISYFGLIVYLLDVLVLKRHPARNRRKWTRFQLVDVRGVSDPLLKYQAEYINWSQSLLGKIDGFDELPLIERVSLLLSITLTKYWRSPAVLLSFAVIANIIFAGLYVAFSCHYTNFSGSPLESFYFSVLMFTGYGNITPRDDLGRVIVMAEVILGYLALGSFLYILGQKVSQRY